MTARIPKDGAVNNKKKLKYCAACNTWVHFRLWKKHKHNRSEVKIDEARAEASNAYALYEKTPLELAHDKLMNEHESLKMKLHKQEKELKEIRQVAFDFGRLLMVLYEY